VGGGEAAAGWEEGRCGEKRMERKGEMEKEEG